jgi:hypothetical protein
MAGRAGMSARPQCAESSSGKLCEVDPYAYTPEELQALANRFSPIARSVKSPTRCSTTAWKTRLSSMPGRFVRCLCSLGHQRRDGANRSCRSAWTFNWTVQVYLLTAFQASSGASPSSRETPTAMREVTLLFASAGHRGETRSSAMTCQQPIRRVQHTLAQARHRRAFKIE